MAYQHDSDGPYVDKGGFRAKYIAKAGVYIAIVIIVYIAIRIVFTKSDRMELALDSIKYDLRKSPYFYSIDSSDDVLTVSLWESGLTAVSKKAYDGDSEAVAEWNKTKYNVLQYANSIDANLILNDVKGMTVFVQVVNEDNHERKLLVFKNCELVYDVTKGE